MFFTIKDFMKKYANTPYSFIRYYILILIINYRRQFKLKRQLRKDPFFHFNYKNITFLISLDPKNGYIDEKISDEGVFEPEMLDQFIHYIHKDMTFIDVGANIGQHTLFASRLVGGNGHVISFEPIPRLYEQIKRSVEKNTMHNINLINAGCGKEDSTSTIYIDTTNAGASSLFLPRSDGKIEEVTVHIKNPIPLLAHYTKIDVIKIDVEGYEYNVLLGLEPIIARDKPILFLEYSPSFYEKNKSSDIHDGIHILQLLQKYGYTIKDLDHHSPSESHDLVTWGKQFDEMTKDLPHRQTNLICTISSQSM